VNKKLEKYTQGMPVLVRAAWNSVGSFGFLLKKSFLMAG